MELDIPEETKNRILVRIGEVITLKAKRLAPIDMGALRNSIQFKIEGNVVTIFSDLDYASDMEYGRPPEPLDANEKDNLKDWSKRHGLPAGRVIKKIETKGIEVGTPEDPLLTAGRTYRPFLRPAVIQSIPDIKRIIKEEIQ